jgi:hypothetical protein
MALSMLGTSLGMTAAQAEMIPDWPRDLPKTCEQRDANLLLRMARKSMTHARLNARGDELQQRIANVSSAADEYQIDHTQLDAYAATALANREAVDAAYQAMYAGWEELQGTACDMTAQEWKTAITDDMQPLYDAFEAAGDNTKTFLVETLRPELKAVRAEVREAREAEEQ